MRRALFLLAVLCFSGLFARGAVYANEAQPVRATVATTDATKLNKGVFGVHGEMLWSPVRLESTQLAKAYTDLGFQVLRFPGGTTANYYLWKDGKFGCQRTPPEASKSLKRINMFNQALQKKGRTYSIDDLIAFSKNTGSSVTLVANVMCGSPDDTAFAVKKLVSSGVDVFGVELGNELYYEEPLWVFSTPSDYLKAARLHARAAKAAHPGVKIGLIASSTAYKAPKFPDFSKLKENQRYRRGLVYDRQAAMADFGDAIIMHLYSKPGLSKLDKLRDVANLEKIYVNAISHLESRLDTTLQYLHRLGPSKEIWVTEWGIAFYGWLRHHESAFEKTAFSGLFYARGLLSLFRHDYVTIANVHNLPDFVSGDGGDGSTGSLAEVARLFKDVVAYSSMTAPLVFDGQGTRKSTHRKYKGDHSELVGRFFYGKKGGGARAYLVIVNSYEKRYRLASLGIAGFDGITVKSIRQLLPRKGNVEFALSSRPSDVSKRLGDALPLDLPPYSVTRIDLILSNMPAEGVE